MIKKYIKVRINSVEDYDLLDKFSRLINQEVLITDMNFQTLDYFDIVIGQECYIVI